MKAIVKTIDLPKLFDQKQTSVSLAGWVNNRRDHGGLIFIDLRDCYNLVQIVFHPDQQAIFEQAKQLRSEWVIEIEGQLKARDKQLINDKLLTGNLEIEVSSLRILNKSQTPPIAIDDDQPLASEDKRLRWRYLDLRRPKMQANLKFRANFYRYLRNFMDKEGFLEVSTPILANSSPEGARDFLVPSRIYENKFYALPQAPQQFKQLLMVGGVARYYQIATCFRDEDPRADRLYGDFYQLDLEMAFVEDSSVVRKTVEPLVKGLIEDFASLKLEGGKFLELTFDQAFQTYGTDKPDLRFGLKIENISNIFKETEATVFKQVLDKQGSIYALAIKDVLSNKQNNELIRIAQDRQAKGLAYLIYKDGNWQGPLVKFLSSTELENLATLFEIKSEPLASIFLIADTNNKISLQALGAVRSTLGDWLNLKNDQLVSAVWITDFPFFEEDEQTKQIVFAHNPFSKPKQDINETEDKLSIKADQFDLVLNGYEVCSGASRNHNSDNLINAFKTLGYDLDTIKKQFGALLDAFQYGAPPHAGCAFGLDRLLMILLKEPNIRQLVAFPKNGSGIDLMMNSPSEISHQQRRELGLEDNV